MTFPLLFTFSPLCWQELTPVFCKKVLNQLRDVLEYFTDCRSSEAAFAMVSFLLRNIGQFHFSQDPRHNSQFLD